MTCGDIRAALRDSEGADLSCGAANEARSTILKTIKYERTKEDCQRGETLTAARHKGERSGGAGSEQHPPLRPPNT